MTPVDRKEKLARQAAMLHDEFVVEVGRLRDEATELRNKPEYMAVGQFLRPAEEVMGAEDYKRFRQLRGACERFNRRVAELTWEVLRFLAEDPATVWRRPPFTGHPQSLAARNSRQYRAVLGGGYELELSWFNYPSDAGSADYRESFHAKLRGKRKVSFYRRFFWWEKPVDFPFVGISTTYDDAGQLVGGYDVHGDEIIDREEQRAVREYLVKEVRRIKEVLG